MVRYIDTHTHPVSPIEIFRISLARQLLVDLPQNSYIYASQKVINFLKGVDFQQHAFSSVFTDNVLTNLLKGFISEARFNNIKDNHDKGVPHKHSGAP
jgi:hypothetical protein